MQTYIKHNYADTEDKTMLSVQEQILAGCQLVYLTEENNFAIYFDTNVANNVNSWLGTEVQSQR